MSHTLTRATPVPRAHRIATMVLAISAVLLAGAVPAFAQENGRIAAPPRLKPGQVPAQLVVPTKSGTHVIVGTWGITRTGEDKELKEVETTIIEFNPDGSYTTRLRNSNFPEWEKYPMAGGRYEVSATDKAGFTLVLERTSGDSEEDKETARSKVSVSVVDEKTLRAPDGAVLTRIK